MPLPLLPLIGIGAGLLGQGANIASTARQNRLNRNFSEYMYDKQRRDALTDTEMQNVYNSPAEQMKRLTSAGLNPNLVYGNGATTTAAPVRSSNFAEPNQVAPHVDTSFIREGLMDIYDVQMKQAQTDNLKAAHDVAVQDAALRAAQTAATVATTANTQTQTEQGQFNLGMAKQLEQVSLEAAKTNLEKTKTEVDKMQVETGIAIDANERQKLLTAQTLQKGVEEILLMRANRAKTNTERDHILQQIDNLKKTGVLQQLEIDLKKKGVSWSDGYIMRGIGKILGSDNAVEAAMQMMSWLSDPEKVKANVKKIGETIRRVRVSPPSDRLNLFKTP